MAWLDEADAANCSERERKKQMQIATNKDARVDRVIDPMRMVSETRTVDKRRKTQEKEDTTFLVKMVCQVR
jgi:hypothetical protein